MAALGAIVGESGSGKSTSLRNLNPEETFIINIANKNLPFKNFKRYYKELTKDPTTSKYVGNMYNSSDIDKIKQVITLVSNQLTHIKQIIIDDAQYLMAFEAMDRANEKGYDKFTQLAEHFYSVLKTAVNARSDLKVFLLIHSEQVGDGVNPFYKIKTIGKMIDSFITLEGLFPYVIFSIRKKDEVSGKMEYKFMTNSDGTNTAKTPLDCFEELYIDNDLQTVFLKIDEYNGESN